MIIATLPAGLLAIILHEAAHIVSARSFGITVKRVGVSWKGVYIVRESGPPMANMITTLAGPFMNLLLACAWPISHEFALMNLLLGLSNLIPIAGSDGQRAWVMAARRPQAYS
jgi:Zn-dependent protease